MNNMEQSLKAPFPEGDIQWRVQQCGWKGQQPWALVLAYVDARAIMDRLDGVCGISGWSDSYRRTEGGVMCTLSLYMDGVWVSREDGADETDIEPYKGGISKALVRAAVKFGIGRYLYHLPVTFAETSTEKQKGWNRAKADGGGFYWKTPKLPAWALPPESRYATEAEGQRIHRAREDCGVDKETVLGIMKEEPMCCQNPPKDLLGKHVDTVIERIYEQAKQKES